MELTHLDKHGNAHMVDVSNKDITKRKAIATAVVFVNEKTLNLIKTGGNKKGDVLQISRLAGIMAAKKTSDLIPLCHPLPLTSISIDLDIDSKSLAIKITATVKTTGQTGVEMEALTAASVAALTIYDMCKAVQKDIRITDIKLQEKSGGKSGHYIAQEERR